MGGIVGTLVVMHLAGAHFLKDASVHQHALIDGVAGVTPQREMQAWPRQAQAVLQVRQGNAVFRTR